MNGASDIVPILLLVLFGLAVSIGSSIIILVLRKARPQDSAPQKSTAARKPASPSAANHSALFHPPSCWLAIRSRNVFAVQVALGLNNPRPCLCCEGLAGETKLFIAPPIKGWILVAGSGLPDPVDDVDVCFRFLQNLSRELGHVQLFSVSRILQHHGWVRVEKGRVQRAYVWAGRTLWTQGAPTRAESELNLKCYDYFDPTSGNTFSMPEGVATNVDRLPLLASAWSLDPAHIDQRLLEAACGIAGEPTLRF